jgi:hypothetical protein
MPKDALGHGSNPRGGADAQAAHSQGVSQVGRPTMQRRQYEAIAGAINRFPDAAAKPTLAEHFASALAGTNPKFDAAKFRSAATTGNMGRTKNASPGMTQQHYEAVAGAIRSLPSDLRGPAATHFASQLGSSNSNFKASRFIEAAAPGFAQRAANADAAGPRNYQGSGTGPGGIGERELTPRKLK